MDEVQEDTKTTTIRNGGKGRRIDDNIKSDAVARAKKAKNRQARIRIAEEIGVHETTLTGWMENPRYNKKAKSTTPPKSKPRVVASSIRLKQATPAKSNGKILSLRDVIARLPSDYDGLLREHIKLLMETHKEK